MLPEIVEKKIQFELGELQHLFDVYAPLLQLSSQKVPDLIEKTALAQVLHSFYNGVENVFLLIAKAVDRRIPSGSLWHRTLLDQVAAATPERPAVISNGTKERLLEFLGFRHVVRHSYSTDLDAERMKGLALHVESAWNSVQQDVTGFLSKVKQP